jgi:hypothetical protein
MYRCGGIIYNQRRTALYGIILSEYAAIGLCDRYCVYTLRQCIDTSGGRCESIRPYPAIYRGTVCIDSIEADGAIVCAEAAGMGNGRNDPEHIDLVECI